MKYLRSVFAVLALGALTLVAPALPASARPVSQAPAAMVLVPAGHTVKDGAVILWYHVCMNSDTSLCWTDEGAFDMEVTTSPTRWQIIVSGSDYEFQSYSGDCAKADAVDGVMVTIAYTCDGRSSELLAPSGSPVDYYSGYGGGYLGTNGTHAGYFVYIRSDPDTGFYWHWDNVCCY